MRILFIIFIQLLFTSPSNSDAFIGKWRIQGGSIIEIYEGDGLFYGKIHKRAENPISNINGLDNKNPVKELRNRQLLGMIILDNLHFQDGELSGGTIYNADSGKTYTVKVWLDEDDKNLCYIRAYKSILFKTFEARRVIE